MLIAAFEVLGDPVGKGRPRAAVRGGRVMMYTPDGTMEYERRVAQAAREVMAGRKPESGPVSLTMVATYSVPSSWSKKKRESALAGDLGCMVKPDIDNVLKIVGDALNGVVWADDRQVCAAHAWKLYGSQPSLWCAVYTL